MKTKWFILLLTLCSVIIAEGFGNKEEKVTCVVSGEDIEGDYKEESAKYKDGEVYFCCGGCKMDFEEDASKFATAANLQLVTTKQYSQTTVCPVSSRKIKTKKEVVVAGVSVDLCCGGCVKKINKSNNKVSMLFSDSSFDKGFSKTESNSSKKPKAKKK